MEELVNDLTGLVELAHIRVHPRVAWRAYALHDEVFWLLDVDGQELSGLGPDELGGSTGDN